MIGRQTRTHLDQGQSPALEPALQLKNQSAPQEKKATKLTGHALDPSKTRKRMQQQSPGQRHTHKHPRIPVLMPPAFFHLIEECIHHCIKKSVTNFRKPLEVGLKLAITLRHLATGETYTSLQYHWWVGRTTICKFVPQVCQTILAEFQNEYSRCPTSLEEWKRVEEKFRTRWNVPSLLGQ